MAAARRFSGQKGRVAFVVDITPSERVRGTCKLCGGGVHRSWRTGIFHHFCFSCRYLRMVYGPNIGVTRREDTH